MKNASINDEINDITVIIPTFAGREEMLMRALHSVAMQEYQPRRVIVQNDYMFRGAAEARNRALTAVDTKWVAFLDDDDTLNADHLSLCMAHAHIMHADIVYPWFTLKGQPQQSYKKLDQEWFKKPFDSEVLMTRGNFIPVTVLAKTSAIIDVGGFPTGDDVPRDTVSGDPCEDWGLWQRLVQSNFIFSHLPMRTWSWYHHTRNTHGYTGKSA